MTGPGRDGLTMDIYPINNDITTEKKFTNRVAYEATNVYGWDLVYHTWNSKNSAAGFPDLVMVKGKRLIFAELKMNLPGKRKGKLSPHQEEWLAGLNKVPGIEVYTWWYPDDADEILKVLAQ